MVRPGPQRRAQLKPLRVRDANWPQRMALISLNESPWRLAWASNSRHDVFISCLAAAAALELFRDILVSGPTGIQPASAGGDVVVDSARDEPREPRRARSSSCSNTARRRRGVGSVSLRILATKTGWR